MDRETFIQKLMEARDMATNDDCLGCLLDRVGLRGGTPEDRLLQAFPGDTYFVTGKEPSHVFIRSRRWLRRVLNASIADAKRTAS